MKLLLIVISSITIATVKCALVHESSPRPFLRGYSAIVGYCDTHSGAIAGEVYSGEQGTLKRCSQRCSTLSNCIGFNFHTDFNRCTLFRQECHSTVHVGDGQPNQNFYLKGEIGCLSSTVGREYVVAFMSNRVAQPKNMSLEMWFTQDTTTGEVIVNIESDPSKGLSKSIRVPYKQAVYSLLPPTWKMTDQIGTNHGVSVEKKAVILSSTTNFVLYGVNKEYFTADAFLGIPSRMHGTRYFANCHWPPFYTCEFAFTPVEDGTIVTITLPATPTRNEHLNLWDSPPHGTRKCDVPYQGVTYSNGDSFQITVNKFEVAQIQDPCDLTGALIEANKPIAFWSGNSRTNIGDEPTRDHQVEQLFSTDTWGTDCAAWPSPNRLPGLVDYWIITANSDNTRVQIDSNEHSVEYFQLNSGESVRFPVHSVTEHLHFSSDKKFQAVKYAKSGNKNQISGDPGMTVCIPTDQFGFGYTFVTPFGVATPYTNYMSIIATQGDENGFTLDGSPIQLSQWTHFPNSNLISGYIKLNQQKQQFRIEHSVRGTRFEAYIYGGGDRESIAYPTGACINMLGECHRSTMFISDGKDNDCDGVIDEELFDGIDNDFDGAVDEDCYDKNHEHCVVVHTARACYNGHLHLNCPYGYVIKVFDGRFGRPNHQAAHVSCDGQEGTVSCPGRSTTNCGWQNIFHTVSLNCNDHDHCSLPVSQFHFHSICPSCLLYAQAKYVCLEACIEDEDYDYQDLQHH